MLLQLSSLLPLLPLPASHPLLLMFQVKTLNSLNSPTDNELALCDRLLGEDFFPRSMWIMALRGNVLYYLHGTVLRRHLLRYMAQLNADELYMQTSPLRKESFGRFSPSTLTALTTLTFFRTYFMLPRTLLRYRSSPTIILQSTRTGRKSVVSSVSHVVSSHR